MAEWFLAHSIKAMGLIHDDKWEVRRARGARYVSEHPGCSERDMYKYLRCSVQEWERDVKPTLLVRGDIHWDTKGRLFPGT